MEKASTPIDLHPLDANDLGWLEFCRQHPWIPPWPEELIKRFAGELISSPELFFDLRQKGRRLALGVLVDKVTNPENLACLEILAYDPTHLTPTELYSVLLREATERLPLRKKGFQVVVPEPSPLNEAFLQEWKLEKHYMNFEMHLTPLEDFRDVADPRLRSPTESDDALYYALIHEAFRFSPDTSIPNFEDWQRRQRQKPRPLSLLLEVNHTLAGFISMVPHESHAEIRSVGVAEAYRGQGLGRLLLRQGLSQLARRGYHSVQLSVAVQNQQALKLYESLGFKSLESSRVYKKIVNK